MSFKLEEKLFISKALISNIHGKLLKSRFVDNCDNEALVDESLELAVLMLKKRNELFGESVKSKTAKTTGIEIDFEEIVKIFNQVCRELSEVTKITKERERLILKILENYTLQDIGNVFKKVADSDYLLGKTTKSTWKANFDWIFAPTNFIKILEDNYKNKENGRQQPILGRQTASTFAENTTGWDDNI
jgi:hypothetical protein